MSGEVPGSAKDTSDKEMKEAYTSQELAEILGITNRSVRRRLEHLDSIEVPNPKGGGPIKKWRESILPEDIQTSLITHYRTLQLQEMERARAVGKELVLVGDALVPVNGNGGGKPVLYDASGREIQPGPADPIHRLEACATSASSVPANGSSAQAPAVKDPLSSSAINPYKAWSGDPAEKKHLPLNQDQLNEALLRADLVFQYRKAYEPVKRHGRISRAKQAFIDAYNRGALSIDRSSFPKAYAVLKHVSLKAIDRWDLLLKRNKNDFLVLADTRGKHRKGSTRLTEDQKRVLLKCALQPGGNLKSSAIREAMKACKDAGVPLTLGEAQLRRVIDKFEREHYNIWVGIREGEKAHNEKCVFHVRRDWNRVKDGHILIADGHKLNFEILNPFTGKPQRMTLLGWYDGRSNMPVGWEIMPTENIFCITSALRRAIIAVGRWDSNAPEGPLSRLVAYMDNGRAFRAKFFNEITDFSTIQVSGLYERLGMGTMFAWPYHAESKPIEGFFGIFAEMERRVTASYTGTSIANKPPWLKRGERIHKELHERFFQGYVPTIFEAHLMIADWFDEYANRKQKDGHLKGKRPIDVFMECRGPGLTPEQQAELKIMMMPMRETWIKRDGIRLPGRPGVWYYDRAMFGKRIPVKVRHDWHPDSPIYVWDLDGNFICEAYPKQHLNPAAKFFGTEEEKEELKRQLALKKGQEAETFRPARALLKNEILPEVARRIEAGGISRKIEAVRAEGIPPLRMGPADDRSNVIDIEPKRTEEDLRRIEAADRQIAAIAKEREETEARAEEEREQNRERYLAALEAWVEDRLEYLESCWMDIYQETPEYREQRKEFDAYRMDLVLKRERMKEGEESEADQG